MLSPEQHYTKNTTRGKTTTTTFHADTFLFIAGSLAALLLLWAFWSFYTPNTTQTTPTFSTVVPASTCPPGQTPNLQHDPPDPNFYDDPKLTYTIDSPPIRNWDEKRAQWLNQHPSFQPGASTRVLMVTGSQPEPCKNPVGDYLLLKLFKNKVDYCRRHGMDIFYNNVLLQPKMFTFWAKTPTVKAAMLAHPEVEWIWWVDSDAAITDMDFELPLGRYEGFNMVVHGWPNLVSWTSINAGVFLIRNCQWGMDFMDVWARMGPQSPGYDEWGKVLRNEFKDKLFPESDDQSGLIYLYMKEKEKWGNKMYLEGEYYFEGYWEEIVENFDNVTKRYERIERNVEGLRRRHAEKVSERYGKAWEEHLKDAGGGKGSWRRPFITHFTGCQPCSGAHNQEYSGERCIEAMQKALTFADNQVLRNYGFVHPRLMDHAIVKPVSFNYPAKSA